MYKLKETRKLVNNLLLTSFRYLVINTFLQTLSILERKKLVLCVLNHLSLLPCMENLLHLQDYYLLHFLHFHHELHANLRVANISFWIVF